MPVVTLDGVDIAHLDSGGTAPAVALAHGFCMDHTMFDAQVADLRHDYRVITWDQRGLGLHAWWARSRCGTRHTICFLSSITSRSRVRYFAGCRKEASSHCALRF